jgi:hypothetical protein
LPFSLGRMVCAILNPHDALSAEPVSLFSSVTRCHTEQPWARRRGAAQTMRRGTRALPLVAINLLDVSRALPQPAWRVALALTSTCDGAGCAAPGEPLRPSGRGVASTSLHVAILSPHSLLPHRPLAKLVSRRRRRAIGPLLLPWLADPGSLHIHF